MSAEHLLATLLITGAGVLFVLWAWFKSSHSSTSQDDTIALRWASVLIAVMVILAWVFFAVGQSNVTTIFEAQSVGDSVPSESSPPPTVGPSEPLENKVEGPSFESEKEKHREALEEFEERNIKPSQ
jgi:hypothetical protein